MGEGSGGDKQTLFNRTSITLIMHQFGLHTRWNWQKIVIAAEWPVDRVTAVYFFKRWVKFLYLEFAYIEQKLDLFTDAVSPCL